MSTEIATLPFIRTKLYRPRVTEDLTPEPLELPARQEAGDYVHPDLSKSDLTLVPDVYP